MRSLVGLPMSGLIGSPRCLSSARPHNRCRTSGTAVAGERGGRCAGEWFGVGSYARPGLPERSSRFLSYGPPSPRPIQMLPGASRFRRVSALPGS